VTGESKGLLIEEARTNLYERSYEPEYYNSGVVTGTKLIAPDGTQTARELLDDITGTSGGEEYFQFQTTSGVSSADGKWRTFSAYIKHGYGLDQPFIWFQAYNGSDYYGFAVGVNRDGTTTFKEGTAADYDYGVEDAGNGWYRLWASFKNMQTGSTQILCRIQGQYWGDSVNDAGTWSAWGMQLEEGSFPTSYIPTSGSQVTRAVDAAEIATDSSWHKYGMGTLYRELRLDWDLNDTPAGVDETMFVKNDGSNTFISLRHVQTTGTPYADSYAYTNNTAQFDLGGSSVGTYDLHKEAVAYNENESVHYKQGTWGSEDTSVIVGAFDELRLAHNPKQLWLGKVAYYPARLPNATLQAMTEE
jgi:hypothetical protein